MPTNQPSGSNQLIPLPHPVEKFQVIESNGTRLVRIDEREVFCLETSDETACRHAAVQLYLCWEITQLEIATAWNVTLRTVSNWVQKYRSLGIAGLRTKTLGPPVKMSPIVRAKVVKMRSEKFKVPEICQRLSISKSTVYRVLEENKAAQNELFPEARLLFFRATEGMSGNG